VELRKTFTSTRSNRFNLIEKKMAEETRQRKKLVEFVRRAEVDTVLEAEVCKFGDRVGWVSRAASEESPMVNYQKKLEQRKNMAKNTPSPTSKSSFLDESPHFMNDKNQTPIFQREGLRCV
jgi:hypothetical protein